MSFQKKEIPGSINQGENVDLQSGCCKFFLNT